MIKYALIPAILAIAPQCQATGAPPTPPPDTRPVCSGDIVYAIDDQPLDCNVNPPTRLDMLITLPADYQAICDHHGGHILFADHLNAHCADIDY